ncbi:DUF1697 domain-containing protein [Flagellimonas allohymeniacidonis]|uniref:DUF1697 domain-containing protein n=1 Tax=Flagellimonas allohymeniacidonis TaxID=2517819 RepID=A0A4Q8QCD2_9FLAO|nr:DUF1697 domain-containing protein [Allomuricauda hymeniacidonis]TAI47991.1 DUF1697 domain-containing protein [Allomuricauda hymeniacidonis]
MKTYIALLRGINVGGQKKIKMAELRKALSTRTLQNVQTYIQSGNIVLQSEQEIPHSISDEIHTIIYKSFGFEVPVLVVTSEEIQQILKNNPFADQEEDNRLYFVLLKQEPLEQLVEEFNQLSFENEDFHIAPNCVYLRCKIGYGNAKLSTNLIEKKLAVEATARNLRTLQKLLALSEIQ